MEEELRNDAENEARGKKGKPQRRMRKEIEIAGIRKKSDKRIGMRGKWEEQGGRGRRVLL